MTASFQSTPFPEAGEVIDGKYEIEGYIGEGGMGAVARAKHLLRKAPVALKFMSPAVLYQAGMVDRFINEAVAASALKSEHVVQVFDVGKLPSGAPYLVLELLDGYDAASLLEREPNGVDVPRAAHIVLQVLRALEVAHAAGIIHRDLKPSNCFLVNHEGDAEFVKLLDFGISKITREGEAAITQTNTALGTPLYMSPEQARSARDVDLRTDIYSTGVILYELLCGQAPHMVEGGEFTAVLYRLFTTDAPPIAERREGLPAGLAEIVHKALAREPAGRFASAREFADALVPYCDERSAIEIKRLRARAPVTVSREGESVRVHSSPGFVSSDEVAATQAGLSGVALPANTTSSPESRPSTSNAVRTDLSSVQSTTVSGPTPSWKKPAAIGGLFAAIALAGFALYASSTRPTVTPKQDPQTPSALAAPSATPTPMPSIAPTIIASATPSATARRPSTSQPTSNTIPSSRSLHWGPQP